MLMLALGKPQPYPEAPPELDQGSEYFFCKGLDSKYFRQLLTNLMLPHKKYPETMQEWVGIAGFQRNIIYKHRLWES